MNKTLQTLPTKLSLGIISLSLMISLPANAQLTRQEFDGNFTLFSASGLLQNVLPENSDYSGFILYEDDGSLQDFAIMIDELNLNLTPDSTLDGGLGPSLIPTINFDFSSVSDWDLSIDFGILFDAPRYTLSRNDSNITFFGQSGGAGTSIYQDSSPNINLSSVPEPLTILGAATAVAFGTGFKRKLAQTKKK
ncbi:MAG: PEP-CTERM sorting domain-containing protein [Crocosphaera sp.]|nr:PEP-CTERM sorting domain-containing protein [Crocosphaera sp.]